MILFFYTFTSHTNMYHTEKNRLFPIIEFIEVRFLTSSDLVYRFLSEGSKVDRFIKQINLYSRNDDENLSELSVGDYVSQFMVYKARYDVSEIAKLQAIMLRNPELPAKEYRKLMEYPNTLVRMLLGYKDEVEGRGRNYSLTD